MIMQQPGKEPNKYQRAKANLKFGMFIHFGVNTFADKEWTDGSIPAAAFNPTTVDADQWVKTAYESGMKFIVLVTKHHEGFCLWDSPYTTYDVGTASNKTDVVRAVSDACRKYGIKLGLYYSLWDRSEPTYKTDFSNGYIAYMRFFPSDFRLADPSIPRKKDPKLFTHDGKTYYLPFEATQCLKPTWFYNSKNRQGFGDWQRGSQIVRLWCIVVLARIGLAQTAALETSKRRRT